MFLDMDMPPPHTPGSVGAPSYKENTAAARRDALNPKPLTLNPKPLTLNPKPLTLNPKPLTLDPGKLASAPLGGRFPPQVLTIIKESWGGLGFRVSGLGFRVSESILIQGQSGTCKQI